MKTVTKLAAVVFLLCSTQSFASDEDERVEHFKGIVPGNVVEAQSIFAEYNAKLAVIANKEKLDMSDMGEIHMLTYTLENQLAYLIKDLKRVADELEELHQLSESPKTDKAHAQAAHYLKEAQVYTK